MDVISLRCCGGATHKETKKIQELEFYGYSSSTMAKYPLQINIQLIFIFGLSHSAGAVAIIVNEDLLITLTTLPAAVVVVVVHLFAASLAVLDGGGVWKTTH